MFGGDNLEGVRSICMTSVASSYIKDASHTPSLRLFRSPKSVLNVETLSQGGLERSLSIRDTRWCPDKASPNGASPCDMEDQGIRCSGKAGEQKRMTLYEKPLAEQALSSRLLLFAAIESMLNTIETEVMIHVHQRRILAPTPHLLRSPRPACHYDGGCSSSIPLQEPRWCRITLPGMAGQAPTPVRYGRVGQCSSNQSGLQGKMRHTRSHWLDKFSALGLCYSLSMVLC